MSVQPEVQYVIRILTPNQGEHNAVCSTSWSLAILWSAYADYIAIAVQHSNITVSEDSLNYNLRSINVYFKQ